MLSVYLYKNLKALRKLRGWTQDEMHNYCGIQRATWSNYENGYTEPNIDNLIRISEAFDVSIDDLILKNFEFYNENGNLNKNLRAKKKTGKR